MDFVDDSESEYSEDEIIPINIKGYQFQPSINSIDDRLFTDNNSTCSNSSGVEDDVLDIAINWLVYHNIL